MTGGPLAITLAAAAVAVVVFSLVYRRSQSGKSTLTGRGIAIHRH